VIGGSSSGKEVLGQVLARLALPSGGSIKLDGKDFFQLPEYVLGARTAYVGQETYLFPLSVRDNLLLRLKIRPVTPATYDDATRQLREAFWKEAERAGNPALDPNADWIDYGLAGATGPADLLPRMVDALKQVELDEDIYSLGLRGTIDVALRPDLAEKILKARHALHGHLQDKSYAGLVETFNDDRYNRNLSVAENLLFGTPVGKQFDGDNIAADPYVQSILKSSGLELELQRMGLYVTISQEEIAAPAIGWFHIPCSLIPARPRRAERRRSGTPRCHRSRRKAANGLCAWSAGDRSEARLYESSCWRHPRSHPWLHDDWCRGR